VGVFVGVLVTVGVMLIVGVIDGVGVNKTGIVGVNTGNIFSLLLFAIEPCFIILCRDKD
jgi:hypothetical protein